MGYHWLYWHAITTKWYVWQWEQSTTITDTSDGELKTLT